MSHAPMDEEQHRIREQIRKGMAVVSADGKRIGEVSEIVGEGFRVDRRLQRDIDVPFAHVRIINDDGIVLEQNADALDTTGLWPDDGTPTTRPPLS